eukprot:TRINITY_DN2896_c0_g1_i1.p2 TRINITY_DN2896_c0_g1~~TRINITY_DN2896_c0_g1_i1.p2  ORF type:complete len:155 (+),score=4.72 TRINITY_DN2896_c0_g1_i1:261-725(+)
MFVKLHNMFVKYKTLKTKAINYKKNLTKNLFQQGFLVETSLKKIPVKHHHRFFKTDPTRLNVSVTPIYSHLILIYLALTQCKPKNFKQCYLTKSIQLNIRQMVHITDYKNHPKKSTKINQKIQENCNKIIFQFLFIQINYVDAPTQNLQLTINN